MFAYKAATSFCLSEERRRRTLAGTVYICLGAGVVTLCVAAVTYQTTFTVFTRTLHLPLLLCTCFAGGVGGIGNVTFWALASRYPTHCTKAVSIGMTAGGLLASTVIVAQNAGNAATMNFGTATYLWAVGGIQLLLLAVVVPILWLPTSEDRSSASTASIPTTSCVSVQSKAELQSGTGGSDETEPLLHLQDSQPPICPSARSAPPWVNASGQLCCVMCFLLYGMTYALPSLVPFMLNAYNGTSDTYSASLLAATAPGAVMPQVHVGLPAASARVGSSRWPLLELAARPLVSNSTNVTTNAPTTPTSRAVLSDELYRWLVVLQNVGDVAGRTTTLFYTPTRMPYAPRPTLLCAPATEPTA